MGSELLGPARLNVQKVVLSSFNAIMYIPFPGPPQIHVSSSEPSLTLVPPRHLGGKSSGSMKTVVCLWALAPQSTLPTTSTRSTALITRSPRLNTLSAPTPDPVPSLSRFFIICCKPSFLPNLGWLNHKARLGPKWHRIWGEGRGVRGGEGSQCPIQWHPI